MELEQLNSRNIDKDAKKRMQMLISAVDENVTTMAYNMNVNCDAIIVNQCNEFAYSEYQYRNHRIQCFHCKERGVGRSRNEAILHAEAEILLFSDEDIVYEEGYEDKIIKAFDRHKEADMLLFNIKQSEGRETYNISKFGRVFKFNCGRYPAYSIAVRRDRLMQCGVMFSMLFGGGARYSNGEDSLFLMDCLKKGMRIYKIPVNIGHELERQSTWFEGYTKKFFYDRGVLYHYLYGPLAKIWAIRFLLAHGKEMCQDRTLQGCYKLMRLGIVNARRHKTDLN